MKLLATFKWARQTAGGGEFYGRIRFDVAPQFITKAVQMQVYRLGKPIRIDVTLNGQTWKLQGEVYDISVASDHSSVWMVHHTLRKNALEWIPLAGDQIVTLNLKEMGP